MRGVIALFRRPAVLILLPLFLSTGCTRHYFRTRADLEVDQILKDKDQFPFWKIDQYRGPYPDPRARFGDQTDPDRPPMPPDDPAARVLAPAPQKPPHKGGVARVEGTGYLDLLRAWDAQNREALASQRPGDEQPRVGDIRQGEVTISFEITQSPENRVELPAPRLDAPAPPRPFLLKLDQAVELGLINSREYQQRREDLYIAALPVTLERFGFAAQFFALEQGILEHTGGKRPEGPGDRWRVTGTAGFSKVFPTGALLLAQYANKTLINLSGRNPGNITSVSTLNLDLMQPLLRGGGRAVTLEPLTQAERNLLYEIRDFARFRKEFFQYMTGGSDLDPVLIASAAFGRGVLVPGNFNTNTGNGAALLQNPGNAIRIDLRNPTLAPSEGYLNSVQKQATIQIDQRNLTRLDLILKLLQAYESGGRVSSLNVNQTQLQYLNGQSVLLASQRDARDSIDRLKLQLGVPTDTPLQLDDQIVRPILEQYDRFEDVFNQFNAVLDKVDTQDDMNEVGTLRDRLMALLMNAPFVRATKVFINEFPIRWEAWQRSKLDDKALAAKLTEMRTERIKLLDERDTLEAKDQKLSAEQVARLKRLDTELPLGDFEAFLRRIESMPWKALKSDRARYEEFAARFRDVRNAFSEVLGEASNERVNLLRPFWPRPAPVLLDGHDLLEGDLDVALDKVVHHALENRIDLMNVRGNVVDAWRAIAVNANALQGVFNVGYHMDSTTPPNQAKPVDFASSLTRHQLVMNLELPLVRVAERNGYRASLIAYQRARRVLMAAEDTVANQVRSEVRNLRLLAQNFRIQRQAVEVAYLLVENSLETFKAPPDPTKLSGDAAAQIALTNNLLQAYQGLPNQQKVLLNTWIAYQIARQQLFLDLEMMPLDFRGVWIDEYVAQESQAQEPRSPVQLP